MDNQSLWLWFIIGIILIFIGMIIILASFLASTRTSEGKVEGGAVIIIGPIPIVLATNPGSAKILMILAIGLMILAIILMLLPSFILKKAFTP